MVRLPDSLCGIVGEEAWKEIEQEQADNQGMESSDQALRRRRGRKGHEGYEYLSRIYVLGRRRRDYCYCSHFEPLVLWWASGTAGELVGSGPTRAGRE